MKFAKSITSKLGYYVYALVDPRNDEIFYVGKATGNNRASSHLDEQRSEPKKNKRIIEIRASGLATRIEILRHGIETENACFDVEATVIDAIGIENLTNVIRGHGISRGRQTYDEVNRLLGSEPLDIGEVKSNYMLFYIHKSYSPTMTEAEIYDCTRQFWSGVSEYNRTVLRDDGNLKYPTALAIVGSVVVRAYSIAAWFPAGSTLSTRNAPQEDNRWEFVGQLVEENELLNMRLQNKGEELKAAQQGYSYINGD